MEEGDGSGQNIAVLAIILGGVIAVSMGQGLSTAWDVLVGLIMAACLKSYGPAKLKDHSAAVLVSMIWGFCALLILSPGIDVVDVLFLSPATQDWHWIFGKNNPLHMRDNMYFVVWSALSFTSYMARFRKQIDQCQASE